MMINNIKKYPKKSAGSLMINDVPIVDENISVKEIEKILTNKKNVFSTINYIYIINSKKQLVKVISIKELFRSPKNLLAKNLDTLKIIYVSPYTDKEKVSMLALKHSLKAVPVINKYKEFLGVVPSDAILQTLYDESTENLLKLSGVTLNTPYQHKIFSLPLIISLKHRLPWLIIGLIGGLLMAGVVTYFENFLAVNIILASFIPLIIYMSDAVGTQMQSFIIRDLAVDSKLNFIKYLFKQLIVTILVALILSLLLFLISLFLYKTLFISLILALALFLAITTSILTGLLFPFIFSRLKLDPADVSGPVATIIQDILSILVYFLVASLILK